MGVFPRRKEKPKTRIVSAKHLPLEQKQSKAGPSAARKAVAAIVCIGAVVGGLLFILAYVDLDALGFDELVVPEDSGLGRQIVTNSPVEEILSSSGTIDSASCFVSGYDEFGFTIFRLEAEGTATGPERATVYVFDREFGETEEGPTEAIECSAWSPIGSGVMCSRSAGDGSSTLWRSWAQNNFLSGKTIEFVARENVGPIYATATATCPDVAERID